MDVTNPYEFIGFGALDVTKPYEFIVLWSNSTSFTGKAACSDPVLSDLQHIRLGG